MVQDQRALLAMTPLLLAGPAACQGPADTTSGDESVAAASSAVEAPTCVTLRRGETGNVQDTFLSGDYPGWAPGDDDNLYIGGSSGGNENHALYNFDFSPIPADGVIVSADFHVHISWSEDDHEIEVHKLLLPWTELGARSSNYDVALGIDPTIVDSFPAGNGGGWRTADVTGLVSGWKSGSLAANGFALTEDPAHHHHSYSSESSPAYRPDPDLRRYEAAPTCPIAPADQDPRSFVMSKRIGGTTADYPLGVAVAE